MTSEQLPAELLERLATPVARPFISVELDNGTIEEQEVELTLNDFRATDIQTQAVWAEIDPQASKLFREGTLTEALFADPLKLRNFLYAVIKPKLSPRVRKAFVPEDFSMALDELSVIADLVKEAKQAI